MSMESALLEGLTDAQRRAVTHRSGAQLVMAGPGSGKTTVVTRRIALLLDQGVSPYSVLALTFTNKAAGEMRDRVRRIIGDHAARGLTIATFHAFAARQLRLLHEQVGVPQDFTIFDASDQKSAAKQAVAESGMDGANWPPASVLSGISRVKQALLSPQEAQMQACDFWSRSMASIYKCYQRILERSHALDFDDLLRLFAVALRDGP
ncbi:MAG: ATP-dependent helicase, partial [Phycisphaerales bacterium]|nr:ATP-dependent helicase [Phycisphaerales bacterium]